MFRILVKVASYLSKPLEWLVRNATEKLNSRLDSPLSIMYADKCFTDRLEKNGKWSVRVDCVINPFFISSTYSEDEKHEIDDESIIRALRAARRGTPTNKIFYDQIMEKWKRRFPLKLFSRTDLGECQVYTTVSDFRRVADSGKIPINDLRKTLLKSLGTLVGPVSDKSVPIGGQEFFEFEMDTESSDPDHPSSIPLLLNPARMRTSVEVLTHTASEVIWRPCDLAKPGRHEAYPEVISGIFELPSFD